MPNAGRGSADSGGATDQDMSFICSPHRQLHQSGACNPLTDRNPVVASNILCGHSSIRSFSSVVVLEPADSPSMSGPRESTRAEV